MTAPLLTPAQVATLLNVRVDQARKLIRLRAFPAIDLNPDGIRPTWRVHPDALAAYIDAHTTR